MKMSTKVKNAIKSVISDLLKLSDKEFQAELKEHMPKEACESECSPETCNGECQGMGDCEIATGFRNAIVPKFLNKPHPLGCQCNLCNAVLTLGSDYTLRRGSHVWNFYQEM